MPEDWLTLVLGPDFIGNYEDFLLYKATSEIAFRLLHSVEFSSLPYLALTLGMFTLKTAGRHSGWSTS